MAWFMTFVQLVKVLIIKDNLEGRKNRGNTIFQGPGIAKLTWFLFPTPI